MNESRDTQRLIAHIEHLEYRLEEYHRHFQESSEQRDLLALDAAWGVANALTGFAALFIVYVAAKELFGLDGWMLAICAGLVGTFVQSWVMVRSDKGRFKDREKMHKFPEWRSEAQKLWD